MPFRIAGGEIRTITVGLKRPFITALGRKEAATNVVVSLRLRGGTRGRGEASSSVVLARQTPRLLAAALRRMLSRFRGRDVRGIRPLARDIWRGFRRTPAAAAAFECAATDALLAALDIPMPAWFGGALTRIETDLTLSADSASRTAIAAREAAYRGFRTLKIKVGAGGFRADLARVLAADAAGRRAGRRPRVLLDGNQRLSSSATLRLTDACLKAGVRVILVEQPLPAGQVRAAARLKSRCPVPVAADESVHTAQDALRVLDAGAADIINVKVAKSGLQGALGIIAVARAGAVQLMIGCMQETARGLTPSVHLACGTGAFDHADLDSDCLLGDAQPRGGFRRAGAVLYL